MKSVSTGLMYHNFTDIFVSSVLERACKHVRKRAADLVEDRGHIHHDLVDTVIVIGLNFGMFKLRKGKRLNTNKVFTFFNVCTDFS